MKSNRSGACACFLLLSAGACSGSSGGASATDGGAGATAGDDAGASDDQAVVPVGNPTAAINLATAGNYVVLAKTGISTVPTSAVTETSA